MAATPDHLASIALELSYRVREEDPEANGAWLAQRLPDPGDRWALIFVIAAAIPQDRTWHDLTAWAADLDDAPRLRPAPAPDRQRPHLQPCGTRAAYRRHRRLGENACQPCKDAAAAYKRECDARKAAA